MAVSEPATKKQRIEAVTNRTYELYGQYNVPKVEDSVNFKVGQPSPTMLPLDLMREAANIKWQQKNPLFLQYGWISGYKEFRQSLSKFLNHNYEQPVDPGTLFMTNGISGALHLLVSVFAEAGDTVFTETPSYFLALSIFRDAKLNIVPIDMDEDGMIVDQVAAKIAEGVKPKFIYTVPVFSNPSAKTLSEPRRQQLADLAAKHDFMIFADEVYHCLGFPGVAKPPKPLVYFDTADKILSLGSFAKICAPALRLGWLQASTPDSKILKTLFERGLLDSSGGLNPLNAGIIEVMMEIGTLQENMDKTKQALSDRAKVLCDAVDAAGVKELGCSYQVPKGGYFLWLTLPEGVDSRELLALGLEKYKVSFLPGAAAGPKFTNTLRLSFSYYSAEDVGVGAKRVAELIKAYGRGERAGGEVGKKMW
jgi:DNA-binding transcriptional MocR family regulator